MAGIINDNKGKNKRPGGRLKVGMSPYWLYMAVFAVLLALYLTSTPTSTSNRQVAWSDFQALMQSHGNQVSKVEVSTGQQQNAEVTAYLTDDLARQEFKGYQAVPGRQATVTTNCPSSDKFDEYVGELRQAKMFNGKVEYKTDNGSLWQVLWYFGPVVLLVLLWMWMMRRMGGGAGGGGGIFSVGKSRAKQYDKLRDQESKVTFKDVAGLHKEKTELMEVVDFLKNPKRYTELGGNIPKGVLLVGPPGTGKTLLARAVAGEADVPFMSMSGSDFVEMFVGVGASRVRDTFRQAKEKAPCIIFIDEIDAIGRARSRRNDFGSNDERENTLNQLLTEMDGFDTNSGIIVLAATNRADILDKAMLRSGRFDRQIYIGTPSRQDRIDIFKVHLRKAKIDGSVDFDELSSMTAGMSGADIANICNEATLLAARHGKKAVQQPDFVEAIDRVSRTLDKPERMTKTVTFADVAGMAKPKSAVREVIDYLKNPEKYTRLGGKIPRGVLLVGPSGSGKTLLAKAVAGEAHVSFFSTSAAEFQGEFVGSGVSRVRELFRNAKEKAPCIIFIDELDAIGSRKDKGNSEREITLNQLLVEMDGYGTNDGVIVMGATNRLDAIDKALLRPGRFDRKCYVGFPGLDDRIEIFKLYVSKIKAGEDVDCTKLAEVASGFSGAEISKTCNEAALKASGEGRDAVSQQDLLDAIKATRKGIENKKSVVGTVKFSDVAGMDEAKQEVTEIVDFLKNPAKYGRLGGKVPRGALLVGPPGTGKTMLARAVAGEANVPFISRSGSDFVEVYVGEGASRVRELFSEAREKAPCVVFIDEIDAIGGARSNVGFSSEHDQTLNQLLTEMDGFEGDTGVIVLAATNREDILDPALLRPGRFDRKIHVSLPSVIDREAIFKVHLRKKPLADDVDLSKLAYQTSGMSGAEIANVCNEAAILAARKGQEAITMANFSEAIDKVTMGLENKSMLLTEQDKYETAVHEAGHATVSWHVEFSDPLVKISIVPRGQALGVNLHSDVERVGMTKQMFLDRICTFMGGRAAEELFLGTIGTGALNDMQQATRIARAMVIYYGMSDALPNISYYDPQRQMGDHPYSDERAQIIDKEISRIVNEQYQRAKDLIKAHTAGHHKTVDALMTREVITGQDVEGIFGKRPWKSRAEELQKIAEQRHAELQKEQAQRQQQEQAASIQTEDNAEGTTSESATSNGTGDGGTTPPPFDVENKT